MALLAISILLHLFAFGMSGSLNQTQLNVTSFNNSKQFLNHTSSSPDKQPTTETPAPKPLLPLWEQPILLNVTNFSWIMNNKTICQLSQSQRGDLQLLPILVHSARSRFMERLTIRKTYGSVNLYRKWSLRFIFLVGEASKNQKDRLEEGNKLIKEQSTFGDLVMGNFIDSYHNMTYKHLMGYKWILNFCHEAALVLKIDDDMFINIPKWVDMRMEDLEYQKRNKSKVAQAPDLYCQMRGRIKPTRKLGDKWYTTMDEWPSELYPQYCFGGAYATNVDFIRKIYSVSRDVRYFWIDDTFVTGVLREVVQNKTSFEPHTKNLAVFGKAFENPRYMDKYRLICDKHLLEIHKREIVIDRHVIQVNIDLTIPISIVIKRGKLFESDMTCLWNITTFNTTLTNIS